MDSIPLGMYPLVKRLEAIQPPLSKHELQSVVFVVRLGDLLHQSFYGSFLTLSLISKLCNHLGIPDLYLAIEVFVMKWSFRQGAVAVSHRMTFDYDMYTVFRLTKISRAILNDTISVKDGLLQLKQHTQDKQYTWIEQGYREFPGRALVIPFMSFTCATVYFGGTWYDLGFSTVCGIVAGLVAYMTTLSTQLTGVMDYLVAILISIISVGSITAFPNQACYSAQVMGTLYWFFYGTAFVLSLYEITNNQLMTGLTRFSQAILRSYGLAFGSLLGVWLSWFGGEERLDGILQECEKKESQIDEIWFILLFPLSAIACLMQFRVSYKHFFICLIVQTIAFGSQYLIGTLWKQPEFVANLVAAYLATLASAVAIDVLHWMKVSSFETGLHLSSLTAKANNKRSLQHLSPIHRHENNGEDDEESLQVAVSNGSSSVYMSQHGENGNGGVEMSGSGVESILPTDDSSKDASIQRRSNGTSQRFNSNQDQEQGVPPVQMNSDTIGFVDAQSGYVGDDEVTYARTDLWFCLMPALYLLVPGSKILQAGFMEMLGAFVHTDDSDYDDNYSALGSSLLVIGLGQVIGLRLGFVTLWLFNSALKWTRNRWGCCKEQNGSGRA